MPDSKAARADRRFDMIKTVTASLVAKYGSQGMRPELIATEAVRFADAVLAEVDRTESELEPING